MGNTIIGAVLRGPAPGPLSGFDVHIIPGEVLTGEPTAAHAETAEEVR